LMEEINATVSNIFTKLSHHKNISVVYWLRICFTRTSTHAPSVSTHITWFSSRIPETPVSLQI
jgi:hypothetical protein